MSSVEHLKKMIKYHREKEGLENKSFEVPICDIYQVIKILDKYKYNDDIKKIYKASLDYERDKNSFSIIFTIHNYKRSKNFYSLLNSEFIQDMFNELKDCNPTKSFINRIRNEKNYNLTLHGDTAIYRTPFYNIKRF